MAEQRINYPGYMDRSQGFTIPENKCFYILSFEHLAYFDLNRGEVTEINGLDLNEERGIILLNGKEIPFIGLWGGKPMLQKAGIGELFLDRSIVTLKHEGGSKQRWEFENFSGDWEQVTFDRTIIGFLFGAPYDFDYRYVTF